MEPFVPLRVPLIENPPRDPCERTETTSKAIAGASHTRLRRVFVRLQGAPSAHFHGNAYYDCLLDRACLLAPAQAYVVQFLSIFQQYPPRQKAVISV